MNIQIIGTKKCKDTQKAERFFKERNIKYHFKDLTQSPLVEGELNNITQKIPLEELLDKESKQYKKRGLEFMVYKLRETLLEDPLLLKTPIVRNGKNVTLGYQPEIWKEWIEKA
ncbi:MAG TPA: ArsC/Spx/MgsR family protein [Ignavibacteriales bacterium]|nr:ArsC/Spx/MgsR family protein [Ignavibacteriales bacterium]